MGFRSGDDLRVEPFSLMAAFSSRSTSLRGFTLIEILAVLLVLAVLAAAVLISHSRSPAGVVTEVAELAAHLRYTQMRALADVSPWSLTISGGNSYQIARSGEAPVRIPGSTGHSRSFSNNIRVTPASIEIEFDQWGRPTSAASDITLTLSDGSNQASITIAAGTGFIR